MPKETVSDDQQPAVVQVIPYDVILSPGHEQTYRVRLYNGRGQVLRDVPTGEVSFQVEGPGTISSDATYQAPRSAKHECALVTCRVGDLTGTARVRIVPPLPWSFDFSDIEEVPLTWIGGRVRYVLRDENGERIMVKRNVLPTPKNPDNKLGTRSYLYMGQIDLANYTIQSDILLTEESGKLPDVGLINSRYTLVLRGMSHKVRLDSWPSHDVRTFQMADFDAQPGVWYTMKLTVIPQGSRAVCRGKIWKRGESEPSDWTVEMVDHSPNLHGSPGLFGNANDAEIYHDNIEVTPNR